MRRPLAVTLTALCGLACSDSHPAETVETTGDASGAESTGNAEAEGEASSSGVQDTSSGSEAGDGDGDGDGDETGMAGEDCLLENVGPVPSELAQAWGLSDFYQQHLDLGGLPILSSELVDPQAHVVACQIAKHMLVERPDVHQELIDNQIRIGIMSVDEVTTDIPEHADLYDVFPGVDWDVRARGLGATLDRPASTVGEENLLHFPEDPYPSESIMVHEFSHTMWEVGVRTLPDGVQKQQELLAVYNAAIAAGLWDNTYAATDVREYWAETVQSWFNTNTQAIPSDGVHNHVNTREELVEYDPDVVPLIDEVYVEDDWVVP